MALRPKGSKKLSKKLILCESGSGFSTGLSKKTPRPPPRPPPAPPKKTMKELVAHAVCKLFQGTSETMRDAAGFTSCTDACKARSIAKFSLAFQTAGG